MKEFFRSFLGSCLGVVVAMLLVVIVIFGIGAAASSGKSTKSADNAVLKMEIDFPIPEKSENLESSFADPAQNLLGLRQISRLLENAASDANVKGIVLTSNSVQLGQASLLQLRESLEEFKKSGKFIYAYADSYSQSSYFLASVADSVFVNPNGDVAIRGFGMVMPFFKGMLDKIGIRYDVFYAGDFKSATESIRRTDMSPENRLQTVEFLDEMLDVMKSKVAESRNISVLEIDKIMDELGGRNATKALENKLVDASIYWDEFEQLIRKDVKLDEDEKINFLSLKDYNDMASLTEKGSYKNKIAVVFAEGDVVYNAGQKGTIDNKKYLRIFSKIKNDKNVKAVVLRVNSGGGSALTSDILWREVENIKAKGIPVIASFGDYAASGGYYIAAGADVIVSAPNTLTGSIGVFSMLPNFQKLANEKLGITFDSVKTHPLAVNLSTVYNMSEKERKYLTESTNDIYQLFLSRVSEGRKMKIEDVHKVAQGRVWTGNKAKDLGLVDEIGFLNDAIDIAAKKAKVEDYKIEEYPKIPKNVWQEVIENIASQSSEEDEVVGLNLNTEHQFLYKLYKKYRNILSAEGVQARMLIDVKFD